MLVPDVSTAIIIRSRVDIVVSGTSPVGVFEAPLQPFELVANRDVVSLGIDVLWGDLSASPPGRRAFQPLETSFFSCCVSQRESALRSLTKMLYRSGVLWLREGGGR